jgi:hypothetical protein
MQHCAGFISAGSVYMFRASSAHHQEYLKLVQRPLVHVLSLQVSQHISLLGPELNACWEGVDLVGVTSVMGSVTGLVLLFKLVIVLVYTAYNAD